MINTGDQAAGLISTLKMMNAQLLDEDNTADHDIPLEIMVSFHGMKFAIPNHRNNESLSSDLSMTFFV